MLDKVYVDKTTGEQVKIVSEDAINYALDNGVRIKKDVFPKRYNEQLEVNPDSFFATKYTQSDPLANIANQLKNLDTNAIKDPPAAGTQVKILQPTVTLADNSMSQTAVKQQQIEEQIHLTPDQKKAMLAEWAKTQPGAQIPEIQEKNWDEDERFLNGDKPISVKPPEPKVDPIQMMFKMFKSNYPVKLKLEIEENIPNPTFIGMVQENVEADAVEYYANLISEKILNDPSKLKIEIYEQLKTIINKELGIT